MKKFTAVFIAIILFTSSFNVFAEDLPESVTLDETVEEIDSNKNSEGEEERIEEEPEEKQDVENIEEALAEEPQQEGQMDDVLLQTAEYVMLLEPFELDEEEKLGYINNELGLQEFREEVESGNNFEDYTIVLSNSFALESGEIEPIGTKDNPFLGDFDGNGKTISNISLARSTESDEYYGFFGRVEATNPIMIKDLSLEFSENVGSDSSLFTGLLAASASNVIIENCSVSGDIEVTGGGDTGGLIGFGHNVTIKDSHVNVDRINHTGTAGGIVGRAIDDMTIEDSTFNGDIVFTGSENHSGVGGIIGFFQGAYGRLDISGCTASGDIIINSSKSVYDIGGIVGYHESKEFIIKDTEFKGNIEIESLDDAANVGGIVGRSLASYRTMDTIQSTGTIAVEGSDAVNVGMIAGLIGIQSESIPARMINLHDFTLNKAEANGSIHINVTDEVKNVGGIVGAVMDNTGTHAKITISESSVSGEEIHAKGDEVHFIGGVAGSINNLRYEIVDTGVSLNKIDVTGESRDIRYISGGVAYNSIRTVDDQINTDTGNSLIERLHVNTDIYAESTTCGSGSTVWAVDISGLAVMKERGLKIKNSSFDGDLVISKVCTIYDVAGIAVTDSDLIIDDVEFTGNITASGSSLAYMGGITSSVYSPLIMNNTKFKGNLNFNMVDEISYVGGAIGAIEYAAVHIKNVSINGDIDVDVAFTEYIGGFAGRIKLDTHSIPEAEMFEDYSEFFGEASIFEDIGIHGELAVEMSGVPDHYIGGISGFASFEGDSNPVRLRMSNSTILIDNISRSGDIIITRGPEDGYIVAENVGGLFNLSTLTNYGMRYEIKNSASNSNIFFKKIESGILTLNNIGSFAGVISGSTDVINSYASGNINIDLKGADETGVYNVGGFVGFVDFFVRDIVIENSYSTADIILKNSGTGNYEYSKIAGFLGNISDRGNLEVTDCYYGGTLNIEDWEDMEDIVVFASAFAFYGGDAQFKNCYYDGDKNSLYPVVGEEIDADKIYGRKTYEMARENASAGEIHLSELDSMVGFDFANTWTWIKNDKEMGYYPQLRVFASSSNSTVKALSKASVETKGYYYAVLDGNGGMAEDGTTFATDWMLYHTIISEPVYILDDVVMLRWNTKADGTGIDYPLNFKLENDTHVYAMYTAAPVPGAKYTVTYDINGGTGTVPVDKGRYNRGDKVTVLGNSGFSRSGYTFEGWRLNGGRGLYQGEDTFIITGDSVLTAVWKKDSDTDKDKDKSIIIGTYKEPEAPAELPELNREEHFDYIVGYPDYTVRPENNITREEIASIYFRLLTEDSREKFYSAENPFTDVDVSRWSNKAISTLYNAGILTGDSEGSFRPSESITRAEAAVIAARFDAGKYSGNMYFSDIEGHWANEYINKAAYLGWIKGYEDGTFKPDNYITRAEAVTFINQVLDRNVSDSSQMSKYMTTWLDNIDESKWYYRHIQEAGNGHTYHKEDGEETWIEVLPPKQWIEIERP